MKKLSVLVALLMIAGVATATDMWYQAPDPSVAGSWSTLSNWYIDQALTTNATALPTSNDVVMTKMVAADVAGVDMVNNWPWQATIDVGSYYNWTNQVINIDADSNCYRFRFGYNEYFTRVECNITNNSTLTVRDDFTPARRDYDVCVTNIESGSTLSIGDNYEANGAYRAITNVSGTMMVGDDIQMSSSCGWGIPLYLGDIYYNFGDGEKTHLNADGDYPLDFDEFTINILAGGYVEADQVTGWNLYGGTYPGGEIHLFGDGLLVLRGAQKAATIAARDAGLISGDGIVGGVAVEYDGTNTYIYVPEPATMMLLGLGAFGLIRRKRS